MKTSDRPGLFQRLHKGLEEAIGFARSELKLRTTELPEPAPSVNSAQLRRMRLQLQLSQQELARTLNVSTRTVQKWEKGDRQPTQAALRLLQILHLQPEVVFAAIGFRTRPNGTVQQNDKVKTQKLTGRPGN